MKGKIDSLSLTSGVVLTVGGFALLIVALIVIKFLILYAFIALILGIVILITLRQQEHVEPIKRNS